MAGFACIYCRQGEPAVEPSEAHVFPYVLGGSAATPDTVCRACNQTVNRVVEMPALGSVLALQSLFGIRGRRGTVRRVQGTFKAGEAEATVYLNERGELTDVVVIPRTGPDGRKHFSILGPANLVEAKMKEIAAAYPDLCWEEKPMPEKGNIEVAFATSETLDLLRRLAAKVALERFAQLRSAQFVTGAEYDAVRSFVLTGNDPNNCAGILADPATVDPLLRPFKPPHHVVYVVAHPESPVLGAFVIFYGLFFFWVVISRRYRALGAMDDLLIQDPQARAVRNPQLRGAVGAILPNWDLITAGYVKDPVATSNEAGRRAIATFQAALEAFYGPEAQQRQEG